MLPGITIQCGPCDVTVTIDSDNAVAMAEVATFVAAHSDCSQFDIRLAIPRQTGAPLVVRLAG